MGGVQTLREATRREQAEEWEQAMQAHRDALAAAGAEKEARVKANYKKQNQSGILLGAHLGAVIGQ